MRRDIWKKLSAESQKRLSSPGCREYNRRREEIKETPFFLGLYNWFWPFLVV